MNRGIDAHMHLWDPGRHACPWLSSVPVLNAPRLPEDYPLETTGAVFVEAGCAPEQALAEVAWVESLQIPWLAGIVAYALLEEGALVPGHLAGLATHPRVVGVRRMLQIESDPDFALAPDFIAGVRALSEFDFSFDLCILCHQMQAATELVRRCPGVRFVLDHLGKPSIRERQLHPWMEQLAELAALPNVCCKLSGLPTEADLEHWTPADLRPYLDHARGVFGPNRVMFGGDWPVVELAGGLSRWRAALDQALSGASDEERDKIFFRNAREFYHLEAWKEQDG